MGDLGWERVVSGVRARNGGLGGGKSMNWGLGRDWRNGDVLRMVGRGELMEEIERDRIRLYVEVGRSGIIWVNVLLMDAGKR